MTTSNADQDPSGLMLTHQGLPFIIRPWHLGPVTGVALVRLPSKTMCRWPYRQLQSISTTPGRYRAE